jgi:competence protein ComFC
MLSRARNFLLDTLFPIKCVSCGKPDVWFCEKCAAKITLKTEQVCPLCEKNITPGGQVCFSCRKKSKLNGLLVAASYQNKVIAKMAHYFKYRFVEDLSVPLGKILVNSFLDSRLPLPEIIIPVPLHKRRLRWRGFNQAELLAAYLSKNLSPGLEIPLANNILIRKRCTFPQMKIKDYSKRKKNMADAFALKNPSQIRGRAILLVDDIATTGATLFECAKILEQKKAKEVYATVLARQEMK